MGVAQYVPSAEVAEIRDQIDHPVIDGDGHLIESVSYTHLTLPTICSV